MHLQQEFVLLVLAVGTAFCSRLFCHQSLPTFTATVIKACRCNTECTGWNDVMGQGLVQLCKSSLWTSVSSVPLIFPLGTHTHDTPH